MALLHIPLDKITEADLQALIETGARESLHIDYKRQTYGGSDADKKEFLADICSFANAADARAAARVGGNDDRKRQFQ